MIVILAYLLIALLQALPPAITLPSPPHPTPTPTATPFPPVRPTPAPTRTATPLPLGAPRQFSRPLVHPISPQNVDVLILGPPHDPTPMPTSLPDPKSWPIGLPSLLKPDGSSAIEVLVFDRNGAVLAHGIPKDIPQGGYDSFQTESFDLDHVLAPATAAYNVVARYRDDPTYDGSSEYLIPDVPASEPHVGSPYILTFPNGAPISTIFYVRTIRPDGDRTFLKLRTRGGHRIEETVVLPEDRWMIGPMVISPDIEGLRRHYLGTNAIPPQEVHLTCYNARGEGAHFALLPRRHVHIDLIVRAAHTTTWVPNDPRTPLDCYGACDGKTGTFVESPLILGFSLNPSDVAIIPPTMITRPYTFHGRCIRGYVVLQGPQQLRDVLQPPDSYFKEQVRALNSQGSAAGAAPHAR